MFASTVSVYQKKTIICYYYKNVSFDVKSLDRTINTTLKGIYDKNELKISISINEMKDRLLLCMKKVHFTFIHAS